MVRPEGPPPGLACGGRLGSDGLLSPTWPGCRDRTGSGPTWDHGPLEQNMKSYLLRKYWSPVPFESQKTVREQCSVDVYWVDSRVSRLPELTRRVPGGARAGPRSQGGKGVNHRAAQERGNCAGKDADVNYSLSPALEYFKMQFFSTFRPRSWGIFYSEWLHYSSLKCLLKILKWLHKFQFLGPSK